MQGRIDKISSPVQAGKWSQVHEFSKDGFRLVAAMSFVSPDMTENETVSVGREVLARLQELIFAGSEKDISTRIKNCLQTLSLEFPTLNVSLGVMWSEVIYVGSMGGGIWVKRGDGREGFVVGVGKTGFASSHLQTGDAIIFANSDFFAALPVGSFRVGIGTSEGAEQLVTMVHGGGRQYNVAAAILSCFSKTIVSKPMPDPTAWWQKIIKSPVYVSYENRDQSRKRLQWVGVGFLVLMLGLGLGFQIYKSLTDSRRIEANTRLAEISQKFIEGRALVTLNRTRSRQLIEEVARELELLSNNKYALGDLRYLNIKKDLAEAVNEAAGIIQPTTEQILDIALVREGSTVSQIILLDGRAVVLDAQSNRLFAVDLDKKSGEVIVGPTDLGTTRVMAGYPGKVEVLGSKGIVECTVHGVQCSVKIAFDPAWGQISGMGMFGGNIYLLSDQTVWRYQVSETGFSEKGDWLAESEDRSQLVGRSSMAIDGYIWLAGSGRIDKYARGVREDFSVSGLDKPLGDNLIAYTDEGAGNIYVLDKTGGRIVVADKKTGQYVRQYQQESLGNISSFVVDEKKNKLYFGRESKIMSIKL